MQLTETFKVAVVQPYIKEICLVHEVDWRIFATLCMDTGCPHHYLMQRGDREETLAIVTMGMGMGMGMGMVIIVRVIGVMRKIVQAGLWFAKIWTL